jgi:hypothetical protein
MIKTGECFYFAADGLICLAQSFVDAEGRATTQLSIPDFEIVEAVFDGGSFVCLLNYPEWGQVFCAVEANEEAKLIELKNLILERF